MNKLLSQLKKDYIVINQKIPMNEDRIIILLNKNTGSYLGSFKLDNERHLVYNTDFQNLSVYEIRDIAKYLEEF